jgi:U3 small nucleolar RNA-associated protein 5
MSANSLIASSFLGPQGAAPAGVAFTSVALDTSILKYQPLTSTSSEGISPLPLDSSSVPDVLVWLDDNHLAVLYSNKPFFDVFNKSDLHKENAHQRVQLNTALTASCTCAVFDDVANFLYVVDTANRVYVYSFDAYAETKIQEINNFVVTDITEQISKIGLYPTSTDGAHSTKLILMSNAVYEFDLEQRMVLRSLNLFVEKTNCFQVCDNEYLLISSDNDRFINVVDLSKFRVAAIFVLNSPVVSFNLQKHKKKSILAAVDQDGFVEIFTEPMQSIHAASTNASQGQGDGNKRRRRAGAAVKSIQHTCVLKLYEDERYSLLGRVDTLTFDHDSLIIAYLQNESYFVLDKINWMGTTLNTPELKIAKKKSGINRLKLKTTDKASLSNYVEDFSQVTVRTGDNFVDLDPVVDKEPEFKTDENSEDDEDNGDDFSTLVTRLDKGTLSGRSVNKKSAANAGSKFSFQVGTLTTNLQQALRNNDSSMFDSIINETKDESVVKSTVAQLEDHFVLKMLDKLAELVYKNKFKNTNESAATGHGNASIALTTWIRYVLVFHGTYLVGAADSNTDLRRRLGLLGMGMQKRAGNMNKLLELKGRLAMVSVRAAVGRELATLAGDGSALGEDDDEEDVEYIEEEEDLEMED